MENGDATQNYPNGNVPGVDDVDTNNSVWDKLVNRLTKRKPNEGRHRYILPHHLSHIEDLSENYRKIFHIQRHYLNNKIRTTKYTVLSFLPKNLFEQFHRFANCYFVLIVILNFLPMIAAIQPFVSLAPVVTILTIQAIKDIAEDYGRYKSDGQVNNCKTEIYKRADNKYHSIKWKKLQVGDIVRLFCNHVIPADVLLLHTSDEDGVCFIETSNIDGETNLKQRTVCKGVGKDFAAKDFKSIIQCEKPNSQIDKFNGNIISPNSKESVNRENLLLRGCVIRNTDYVEGIVLYAGHETKAMLNNNGPRYKRSKLERRMNLDVIWCVILLVIMCTIGAIGNSIWASYQSSIYQTILFIPPDVDGETLNPALSGFYMFWTMVILLQVLIPISLYVSIEIVKMGQVFFINQDLDLYHKESGKPLECRALNITEDLGQVQYVFSDKTGTLTENSMVFRRCTVGGLDYPHAANAARIENNEPPPPEMNPTTEENAALERETAKAMLKATRVHSAPFSRDGHRASYRRPGSSSVRAHHRRNLSSISVQQLQRRMVDINHRAGLPNTDGDAPASAQASPMHLRRAVSARTSARRQPHKHHRRNISTVSAKEIMSNLAPEDQDEDLEREIQHEDMTDDEEEFMEADVTPDPVLYKELESIAQHPVGLKLPSDKNRILDFFINLAICNTVVLSTDNEKPKIKKEDMMDVIDSQEESKPLLRSFPFSVPNLFRKSPAAAPETFRSLMDDSMHEATNNLYTISSGISLSDGNKSINNSNDPQNLSFSREYLAQLRYEAESPDEAALVYAAHAYGCSLAYRGNNTVTVTLPKSDETISFEVLHTLAFDSTRKRMSVVVKDLRTNQYVVYCKGADSTILQLLRDPAKEGPDDDDSGNGSEHSYYSTHQESNSKKVLQDTNLFLNQYARAGLRTLCIAKRVLTNREYQQWAELHKSAELAMEDREQKIYDSYVVLEKELELLGATGIEDRLQDGVPEAIESLRNAGMQVWVITGDKQETAVNIGYSCKLIEDRDEIIYLNATSKEELEEMLDRHTEEQNEARGQQPDIAPNPDSSLLSFTVRFRSASHPSVSNNDGDHPPLGIVIDGKTLDFALDKDLNKKFIDLARRCNSVLVCRATPLQKGQVVKLVKETLHVMTLAVGDGANDVSMIQVADIGVGISGQEGMQAVMSSDFAMARFRFLQKLLLVHGHWNYARLAAMVLYFFYKNTVFVFLIFWYQFYCGYSGANPIEQMYLILFGLLFTSLPPLINGVLDKDVSSDTLMRKPKLYLQGINNEMYKEWSFWINIVDGIYQSLILFFVPFLAYWDTDVDVLSWGTPVTTACMFANLVHLAIETKTWTWIHLFSHLLSVALFFGFSFVYDSLHPVTPQYWLTQNLVGTSNYWFSVLLATALSLLPRYIIRVLQTVWWATESQKERVYENSGKVEHHRTANTTANSSMNGTSAGSSSTYQNGVYDDHQDRGESGTDHLAYEDHLYNEIQRNSNNQNNTHGSLKRWRPKSAPSLSHQNKSRGAEAYPGAYGLSNPAYSEEILEGSVGADARGKAAYVNEPETGEIRPITNGPDLGSHGTHTILTAPGAPHHTHHHVAFQAPANTANNNKDENPLARFSTASDSAGMTSVNDALSLASTCSVGWSAVPHDASQLDVGRPTKIYVASQSLSPTEAAAFSECLPNVAESGLGNLPFYDVGPEDLLYDTVA